MFDLYGFMSKHFEVDVFQKVIVEVFFKILNKG
jgi:hypothetical protein